MKTRRIGWLALSGFVFATSGCGSSGGSTNAPASASAACEQLHAASAARSARCLGGEVADWAAYVDQEVDCAAYDQQVADGQVEYRRQDWDACLAAYAGPCDQEVGFCFWEVLHGRIADGQPCRSNAVCDTYSACLAIGGNALCGEICVRAGRENEACGVYCGGTTPCLSGFPLCEAPFLTCVNDVCVKTKVEGESCGATDPVPCRALLSCSADPIDPESTGICQPRVAGGRCSADADCPGVEFCLEGTCTARRPVGASCADAPTGCVPWTVCDGSGFCSAAGRPGLACAPFPGAPDFLTCASGRCGDGMTCTRPADVGEACVAAGCVTGSACDPSSSLCVACSP